MFGQFALEGCACGAADEAESPDDAAVLSDDVEPDVPESAANASVAPPPRSAPVIATVASPLRQSSMGITSSLFSTD
jgi:hypothetical protein